MNELEKKSEDTSLPGTPGMPSSAPGAAGPAVQSQAAKTEDLPTGSPGRAVPLKYPFKSGDESLSRLVFPRRPKARDLIQTHGAATPAEQELYSIAALVGINAEDLKEMDGQDYLAVQKEWAAFLGV